VHEVATQEPQPQAMNPFSTRIRKAISIMKVIFMSPNYPSAVELAVGRWQQET